APDGGGDAIEVLELGRVRLDGRDVGADELHRFVERVPAPTEDEYVRALLYEPPGDGESDAARTAADDCDLVFQYRHNASLHSPEHSSGYRVDIEMGPAASGAQCGSSHFGGAKSNQAS